MDISERSRSRREQSRLQPLDSRSSSRARYKMRLFIAGSEPNSVSAQRNIDQICSRHLKGNSEVEVINVFEDFAAAIEENILVTPALVIDKPKKAKIFGNLQDEQKVLSALDLL